VLWTIKRHMGPGEQSRRCFGGEMIALEDRTRWPRNAQRQCGPTYDECRSQEGAGHEWRHNLFAAIRGA
jgi:hypothetical protein